MRKNCKGCAYRTISCHSSCQVYLEFQTRNEEKKKKKEQERLLNSVTIESSTRAYYDRNNIHKSIYGLYVR